MPLIFQDRITRAHLHSNPERRYLFGDNEARTGRGGQAAACRGEPNAIGIATKRSPSHDPGAYWTDADYDRATILIDADFAPAFTHVRQGGTVVCPSAGIGTGLSELPTRAPRIFAHLRQRIIELKRLGAANPEARPPRVLNKRCDPIPTGAVYCGRPSIWGNPFVVGRDGSRDEVITHYERWLMTQPHLLAQLGRLRGRHLVCWCAPLACHCDVLIRLASPPPHDN